MLAALLITRQVMGNVKESLVPYAKKQFKLAKINYDLFGGAGTSPTEEKPGKLSSSFPPLTLQGAAKRLRPGSENDAGKLRHKW